MKARIVNGTDFGGTFPQIWLDNNQNIEFAGQLVSEWELTTILPDSTLKLPVWNGTEWEEGLTLQDINALKIQEAILIDLEYTARISDLLRKAIEKLNCDGIPIPQDKLDERDALRLECNNKILALGITDFTYRASVKGL